MKINARVFRYMPLGLASSVMTLTLVTSPVAMAQQGSDDSTQTTTNTATTSPATTQGRGSLHTTLEVENGDSTGVHAEGQSLLQTERKNHKEHTTSQRQQACVAHQTEINKRVNNYAAAAQRHLDTFTSIFTKVQAFQTSKQLSVANYDNLVTIAKDKQATAQTAVDALKALDVKIDCTQNDPASSVATLKAAVKDARTALQNYRSAIKDVTVALKGASSANDSSTGGDQ